MDLHEAGVLRCREHRAREPVGLGRAGLLLDHARHELHRVLGDQLGLVGLCRRVVSVEQVHHRLGSDRSLVEDRRLLEEGDRVVPVLGAQRGRPALVLLEQPAVALPARVREAELGTLAVAHLHGLELVSQQDLLELRLLLDVDVLLARPDPVERRLGDVHVAGVDQLGHLAVEEREHQGADVGAVDIGVGHDDDLVVARLLDVELLADAGSDGGDQRADLLVREHLVDAVLLDVDDLAAQREDRLGVAVAALLGRAAGRVALDDEDLRQGRVADRAVGQLARQGGVLERRLAPGEVACLARRLARPRSRDRLRHDLARLARVLLEELGEALVDRGLHEALDRRVAELGLGLALELRVGDLDRDDRGQALAHVLALQVGVLLLELALLARVGVDRAGERRAEAGQVRAALMRVDVVGERQQRLLVGVVPLHGDLDLADLARVLHVDDLVVQRRAGALAVEVVDEVDDAAVVLERDLKALAALVAEVDAQALRQEGHLAEALLEDGAVVLDRLEDLEVGQEGDARAAAVGLLALGQAVHGRAALVGLLVLVAVAPDREVEPLGQRVDHGDAHPVEASRDLVAAAVAELAAGVQDGQDDLRGGPALLLVHVDRDPAAVVGHAHRVVRVDDDLDLVGLAGERLVDGVVDDLVDQVMQPARARRADVHARALSNGLEALEDGDVLGVVGGVGLLGDRAALAQRGRHVILGGAGGPADLVFAVLGPIRQAIPFVIRAALWRPWNREKPRLKSAFARDRGVT